MIDDYGFYQFVLYFLSSPVVVLGVILTLGITAFLVLVVSIIRRVG